MRIELVNVAGSRELPATNLKIDLILYNNLLRVTVSELENVEVEQSGIKRVLEEGINDIPIEINEKNQGEVIIRTLKNTIRFHFITQNVMDIGKEMMINLADFANSFDECFQVDKEYSLIDLFDGIRNGNINLLVVKNPITGFDDESLIDRIAEVIPMIMDICSHPKKSLRVDEAILDVSLVKRINSNTMKYLSSHSEHWKARTLNGLIPSRLKADTFEDEINIYENLFFKMAVSDILVYVANQAQGLEKAIGGLNKGLNWEKYGNKLNDYKRIQILNQLMPDFDAEEGKEKKEIYFDLLRKWNKLGAQLTNAKASQFYRSISKKRIGRNIHPTNILKKDSRYNALFRLWNDIQMNVTKQKLELKALSADLVANVANSYSLYVSVLLVYVFDLMELTCNEKSFFVNNSSGCIKLQAEFSSNLITYKVATKENFFNQLEIEIVFQEKQDICLEIPECCHEFYEDVQEKIEEIVTVDDKYVIHFRNRLSDIEENDLLKVFKISQSSSKNMDPNVKRRLTKADREWRETLNAFFISGELANPKEEVIYLIPQFALPSKNANEFRSYTDAVLTSDGRNAVYTFPFDVDIYKDMEEDRLVWRLINYGEKYSAEDAQKWGSYKKGILPIGQTELYSAQRLIKLISLHSSKLIIEWNGDNQVVCPECGKEQCHQIDSTTWSCDNRECGIVFGKTKCADGCGEMFEWTRPSVEMDESDYTFGSSFNTLLEKEDILGRLAITDFDFVEVDKKMKYYPICPKCGKRRKH